MAKVTAPGTPVTPLSQDTRTTCWYTCYRMMWIWKFQQDPGELTSQRDAGGNVTYLGGGIIKDKLTANDDKTNAPLIDWDDACKSGLKAKDYLKAAKALGMHALACGTGLDLSDLQGLLRFSPVWVAGNWHGYDHNVVVIEASEKHVKFADPWSDVGIADTETNAADFFLYGNNFQQDSSGNITKPGNPQGAYYFRGWYQFQRM